VDESYFTSEPVARLPKPGKRLCIRRKHCRLGFGNFTGEAEYFHASELSLRNISGGKPERSHNAENRANPASTAPPQRVKAGAKILQIFTRFDLP
jgi:hypothetical protein